MKGSAAPAKITGFASALLCSAERESVVDQKAAAIVVTLALLVSGCAGMDPETRATLQEAPTCPPRIDEISLLLQNKPVGWWRIFQGVQAVAPPLAALSLLRDVIGKPYRSIYLDHWRVAFGSYNEQIDQRVRLLNKCDPKQIAEAAAKFGAEEMADPNSE